MSVKADGYYHPLAKIKELAKSMKCPICGEQCVHRTDEAHDFWWWCFDCTKCSFSAQLRSTAE